MSLTTQSASVPVVSANSVAVTAPRMVSGSSSGSLTQVATSGRPSTKRWSSTSHLRQLRDHRCVRVVDTPVRSRLDRGPASPDPTRTRWCTTLRSRGVEAETALRAAGRVGASLSLGGHLLELSPPVRPGLKDRHRCRSLHRLALQEPPQEGRRTSSRNRSAVSSSKIEGAQAAAVGEMLAVIPGPADEEVRDRSRGRASRWPRRPPESRRCPPGPRGRERAASAPAGSERRTTGRLHSRCQYGP